VEKIEERRRGLAALVGTGLIPAMAEEMACRLAVLKLGTGPCGLAVPLACEEEWLLLKPARREERLCELAVPDELIPLRNAGVPPLACEAE